LKHWEEIRLAYIDITELMSRDVTVGVEWGHVVTGSGRAARTWTRLMKTGWARRTTRVYRTGTRCRRRPLSMPIGRPAGPCTEDDRDSTRPTGAIGATSLGPPMTSPEISTAGVASGSEQHRSVNALVRQLTLTVRTYDCLNSPMNSVYHSRDRPKTDFMLSAENAKETEAM